MAMKNEPFEDVFPIEHADLSLPSLFAQRVIWMKFPLPEKNCRDEHGSNPSTSLEKTYVPYQVGVSTSYTWGQITL